MTKTESYYREKVYAPWWIWFLALAMCGSLAVAFGAALGDLVGLITFAVTGLLTCWALLSSAYVISIDHEEVIVGKARLPLQFCGDAVALSPAEARSRRGPEADPACYLVLRGWINKAVTIAVADALDPTPYWFVSTRKPEELVSVLARLKRTQNRPQ